MLYCLLASVSVLFGTWKVVRPLLMTTWIWENKDKLNESVNKLNVTQFWCLEPSDECVHQGFRMSVLLMALRLVEDFSEDQWKVSLPLILSSYYDFDLESSLCFVLYTFELRGSETQFWVCKMSPYSKKLELPKVCPWWGICFLRRVDLSKP